jgi:hypothetical protein
MLEREPANSAVAKPKAGTAKATQNSTGAATAKPAERKSAPKTSAPKAAAAGSLVRKARTGKLSEAELEALIRQRAYELWERDGRPDGRDDAHWAEAEREVGAARAA